MKAKLSLTILLASAFFFLAGFTISTTTSTTKFNAIDTFPFVNTLKEFKGKTVSSLQGAIALNSGLHNDFYYIDSSNQIGYYYVEIKVGTFSNLNKKRLPLNIALVIDRSGSMAGAKMHYAKEAAKAIIDILHVDDLVSVIMYDHEVTLLQSSVKALLKDSIKRKIDAIEERGSTNLWGGSEKGYEQLKVSAKANYINRVLLLSDGLANSGLTNARVIQNKVRQFKDEEGITLSTFGVGLDYNEVLMTDMAESGAGNYHFIGDLGKMKSILEKEINGLSLITAKNATLNIDVPQGIQIAKIYGYKAETKGNRLTFTFRDLFSEEIKGVLIQYRINAAKNGALAFNAMLQYSDVADGSLKLLQTLNERFPVVNAEVHLTQYNKNVLEQTVLFQSNEALEKAMLEVDRGLFEGARLSLQKNKAYIDKHESLLRSSKELQRMDSLNQAYYKQIMNGERLGQDSLKLIQKSNRAGSYNIRRKKS